MIASLAAALGLASAALGADAYAVRIAGAWRPGGPFGYPPALALLVVSALPALLAAMGGRSRLVAGAAALGTALAGGVLALAASRTALALAVIVAGAALASAHSREQRRLRAAALCLGVAAALALGASGQSTRGAVLAAVMLLSPPVWLVARRRCATGQRRAVTPRPRCSAVATTVVAGLAVLASVLAFGAAPGRGAGPAAGFLHGRSDTWIAALGTFADDPLKGAGADAFLAGSARHQGGATITFAHSLPLESAAELGVAGLALSLGLYLAVGRLLWRARCTPAGGLLGPAAAAFLASSLVDWPWHLAGTGAVWALAAGALAGSGTVPEKTWISGRAVKHGLI